MSSCALRALPGTSPIRQVWSGQILPLLKPPRYPPPPPLWSRGTLTATGLLTRDEFDQYNEQGFVLKHNVFRPEDLVDVIAAVEQVLPFHMHDMHRGIIMRSLWMTLPTVSSRPVASKTCARARGSTRGSQRSSASSPVPLCSCTRVACCPAPFSGPSPQLHNHTALTFCSLWSDPRLLSAATQLLGPNLAGHPVWNLRTKVCRALHL